jgi:hypothetical protein
MVDHNIDDFCVDLPAYLCGGWGVILSLRVQVKFPLEAGHAGMLVLSCTSLAIHVVMIVPFKTAALFQPLACTL